MRSGDPRMCSSCRSATLRSMAEKVTIVAHRRGSTNDALADAWCALGVDARVLAPEQALHEASPEDVVVVRLDVREALDGIEPGLEEIEAMTRSGVRVLNRPDALRAAHDKLETARCLEAAGLPHPRTVHVTRPDTEIGLPPPVVVKPRHGSWGRDVFRCETVAELAQCLDAVRDRPWFQRHGAIVQQLVPMRNWDLRLIVANGLVIGAAKRAAAPGEWRTNVSLGGGLLRAEPDEAARALAAAAVAAIGADFVGVDLGPTDTGYVVLELNGAVDFDRRYSHAGMDVYAEAAFALGSPPCARGIRSGCSKPPGLSLPGLWKTETRSVWRPKLGSVTATLVSIQREETQ